MQRCETHALHKLILILLCMGLFATPSAQASVAPRSPKVVFSHSPDFLDIVFVIYDVKADDPWAKGSRVDASTAKMVSPGTDVDLPFWQEYAVLAVPRAVAEKTKGTADPAWLEPSAAGVIRVPEKFLVPSVFRDVTLRYQLEKGDKGPTLVLLDKEILREAVREPPDTSAMLPEREPVFLTRPLFLWGLLAGGVLGLAIGACYSRLKRS